MDNFSNFVEIHKLKREKLKQTTVTLQASAWTGNETPYTQTVAVDNVTASNIVIIAPQPTSDIIELVSDCRIIASSQANGELTFLSLEAKPDADIIFNVVVGGV